MTVLASKSSLGRASGQGAFTGQRILGFAQTKVHCPPGPWSQEHAALLGPGPVPHHEVDVAVLVPEVLHELLKAVQLLAYLNNPTSQCKDPPQAKPTPLSPGSQLHHGQGADSDRV